MRERLIAVPMIADGNPSAAMAWAGPDNQDQVVGLTTTSWPVERFHGGISEDPAEALEYVGGSEAKRRSPSARLYAAAAFCELATRLALRGGCRELVSAQEHPLMLASTRVLSQLGVETVRMIIPDVNPKDSAVHTANRLAENGGQGLRVVMSVWNDEAAEGIIDGKPSFEVERVEPWLLNLSEDVNSREGDPMVLKLSGSGMPGEWERSISCYVSGSIWAPNTQPDRVERILGFYRSLGTATRLIVGYPSELMQATAAMQAAGISTQMVCLPPRGEHEQRNLVYGARNNLVAGGLVLPGVSLGHYGVDDLTLYKPQDLATDGLD